MTLEELQAKVKEYMHYLLEAEYEHEPDNILAVNKAIHKIIEKEKKYCWHDIRTDKTDLPKPYETILFETNRGCYLGEFVKKFHPASEGGCVEYDICFDPDVVIGWRYYEYFEDCEV